MKASDLFVKSLEAEGVEYVFGIPGEENLDLLESLRLYGPPAMIFYDAKGDEEKPLRVQSEISASALLARVGI